MFHWNVTNGAGVSSFFQSFVKSLARPESVAATPDAIVAPPAEAAASAQAEPVQHRPRGRLIDLERRAKFGQFGPTPR